MRYIDQRRDYIQFCFARHPIAKTEAFRVVIGAEASGINPVAGYKKTPRMKIGDKEQEMRRRKWNMRLSGLLMQRIIDGRRIRIKLCDKTMRLRRLSRRWMMLNWRVR
jgi:hypothetical protein